MDTKQAVTESSPDSQEVTKTDVTAQKAETSVKEETQPKENPQEGTSSPEEQKAQVEDKKSEQSPQPEEKPQEQEDVQLSEKAQKRFQELIAKLKEKDKLLEQKQQPQKEEIPVEYDDEGNPIVDPQKLIEVAEQRAYQKALQAVNQERQIQEYRQKATEFLEDAKAISDELKSNKSLEKLATRIFEAENYVIDPVSGDQVFVPRRKLSEIVSELKKDLEGFSLKAQADMQVKLQEEAESGAIRPSEHTTKEEELTQEQIHQLLIKNPRKLAEMLEKKLGFAE